MSGSETSKADVYPSGYVKSHKMVCEIQLPSPQPPWDKKKYRVTKKYKSLTGIQKCFWPIA